MDEWFIVTLQREGDGLLEFLQLLCERQGTLRNG